MFNADPARDSAYLKDVPPESASGVQKNLTAGMTLELRGNLVNMGFGDNLRAPVVNIKSFRSMPASSPVAPSQTSTSPSQASTSTTKSTLRRLRSRSREPDAGPPSAKRAATSTKNVVDTSSTEDTTVALEPVSSSQPSSKQNEAGQHPTIVKQEPAGR